MLSLGIDTSNYTSSLALAEDGKLLAEKRQLLAVSKGERGLRQSDALYQHWNNLPRLFNELTENYDAKDIDIICVSSKPRPQEASYMPVFNAGLSMAKILAAALKVPVFEISHQEGHIIAAAYENNIDFSKPLLSAHLSGGTLEIVLLKDGQISIVGGTKDISYGQLIDRTGVGLGMNFPAGREIDRLALEYRGNKAENPLCKASFKDGWINLSGLETQLKTGDFQADEASYYLMERISESFVKLAEKAKEEFKISQFLVTGGVAASQFLRDYCKNRYIFGRKDLVSDNASGLALCGGKLPWL